MAVISLTNVVLSFPKLVEAASNKDFPSAGKKFAADFILPQSHPDYARFMAEVMKDATEKWKEHTSNVLNQINNDRRLRCFGNGTEKIKKDTFKPYEGYEGNMFISASANEDRPPVIVRPEDGKEISNTNTMERLAAARKLYGGCRVNVAVRPWIQDNQFGRAVRCELVAVQFAGDGTPFGEAPPDISSMFGAVQGAAPAAPAAAAANAFPAFFNN